MSFLAGMRRLLAIVFTVFVLAASVAAQTPVSLLGGKLTFTVPSNFRKSPDDESSLASYEAADGDEWASVSLAGKPLRPGGLEAWMERKKASYTADLPPEIREHLRWTVKKIVKRHGVEWADLRFDCVPDGPDGKDHAILYTRFLATTIDGKLLEFVFSGNLTADAKRKAALDQMADSVKLAP
jgi:hypothetical protein